MMNLKTPEEIATEIVDNCVAPNAQVNVDGIAALIRRRDEFVRADERVQLFLTRD